MKHAVVTGASTGIGRAVSIALSRNGFVVYLIARNQEKLEETRKQIVDGGGQAVVVVADLSSFESVNAAIQTIKSKADSVDLLANIAGLWHGKDEVYAGKGFETFDQQVIIDTYQVGTISPTLLSHAFIPLMKPGSKIINLSGTFENGAKGWLPYYVSKRAIEDLTIGLSHELESKDIQVNCISPSDTATDAYAKFFPQYMNEAIDPQKIADKFVELSDPNNKVTGKVFVVKKGKEPVDAFHS